MRLLSVTVLGGALIAAGLAGPATGEATATGRNGIVVQPDVAHPGERVEIEVPGCAAGPQRYLASSPAFAANVPLAPRDGAGRGAAQIRPGLAPGVHTVVARCGSRTVTGSFKVSHKLSWTERLPADITPHPAS